MLLSLDMMSPFNEFIPSYSMYSIMFLFLLSSIFFLKKFFLSQEKLIWLFISLALVNFLGLSPYSWPVSMYPVITLLTASLLWSVFSLSSLVTPRKKWMDRATSHYLPLTTPIFLWAILPVIELVSQIIRPVTLTIRLTANLVAGHILIILVSFLAYLNSFIFLILIPFEMMVALVQGYVFIMLLTSYSEER